MVCSGLGEVVYDKKRTVKYRRHKKSISPVLNSLFLHRLTIRILVFVLYLHYLICKSTDNPNIFLLSILIEYTPARNKKQEN